ncbi:MAG: hypothetical protein QM586_11920 [Xenophilus sp.]
MSRLTRPLSMAAAAVAVSLLATACVAPAPYYAAQPPYPAAYPAQPVHPAYVEYGQVTNIEVLQGQTPGYGTTGGGAVAGALIGGVVGNGIGRGAGRAAATALGVVGGALAGNAIEAQSNAPRVYQSYRISVHTDNGVLRVFDVPHPGDLRIGDRVRIADGQISRY